jgi:hypothetical protein
MNNRRLRRALAALALTAAALLAAPAVIDDTVRPQQDTTWGADTPTDTTWGTPDTGTGTVAPADTTW